MKPYTQSPQPVDLAEVRARLGASKGKQYWRSLEEAGQTLEFQEFLHREFPAFASEFRDDVSRRNFLKLMGASLALAGVTMSGCTRQPINQIIPYVKQPEEIVPGKPLFFATAMDHDGFGTGLLVESHEGHPTKIEGNPEHPSSQRSDEHLEPGGDFGFTTLTDRRRFCTEARSVRGARFGR